MLKVVTDRDSVAMGDDMKTHKRELSVPVGILLSELIELVKPDVQVLGWSWVVRVGWEAVAVWSIDQGVQLLATDHTLPEQESAISVDFQYFQQLDPQWLHQRLMEGARPRFDELQAEYAPIAAEDYEHRQRQRERDTSDRLLAPKLIEALTIFGAVVDLHSDVMLRFVAADETWVVRRADTMTDILQHSDRYFRVSIRPLELAATWLVAMIASEHRKTNGKNPLPEFQAEHPATFTERPSLVPGKSRWNLEAGPLVVQGLDETGKDLYNFVAHRELEEIVSMMLG